MVDWLDRMNNAMDYIEANLADDISYDKIAQLACCSVYHFQRMFPFITGVTLSEYIRRRRLTLAAFELHATDVKVIDVAVKYGYESQAAFTRAFKNLHGVMPISARDNGVLLKTYPRLSFHISIKGDIAMNYRIVQTQSIKVFGKSTVLNYSENQMYEDAGNFVLGCVDDGTAEKIGAVVGNHDCKKLIFGPYDEDETNLYGVTVIYEFNKNECKFLLGMDCPDNQEPAGFEIVNIPGAMWAVFSISGPTGDDADTVKEIWQRLPEWFQASEYEHAENIPELERYYRMKGGHMKEV